jgi:hypothetical protein
MNDPKHLPRRDCLVLYPSEYGDGDEVWIHVSYEDENLGGEPADAQWFHAFDGQRAIDPSLVVTWAELPDTP